MEERRALVVEEAAAVEAVVALVPILPRLRAVGRATSDLNVVLAAADGAEVESEAVAVNTSQAVGEEIADDLGQDRSVANGGEDCVCMVAGQVGEERACSIKAAQHICFVGWSAGRALCLCASTISNAVGCDAKYVPPSSNRNERGMACETGMLL